MKTASAEWKQHFSGDITNGAWLWKVKRTDGVILGFTTHDRDITFNDGLDTVTYLAATGFTNTAAKSHSDLTVDDMEVTAFLNSDSILEADVRAQRYDYAYIEIRLANWADLSMGAPIIRAGFFGILKMVNGVFTAEILGLATRLKTELGDYYGPVCRATFGSGLNGIDMDSDWLCLFDVTTVRQTGTVGGVSADARTVVPAAGLTGAAGWFDDGIIIFTSGPLDGLGFEIKHWDGTELELFFPMPYSPVAGDTFTIEPGCDHTAVTGCQQKFNNLVNFQAEPNIPGMDEILGAPLN